MWFSFLTYDDEVAFKSHWNLKTGATLDDWFTKDDGITRYIIIDELNAHYHKPESVLWKYLKSAQSSARPYIKVWLLFPSFSLMFR